MKCFSAPYEGDKDYIFFSYCHKDAARVYPVIERLSVEGFRVWYDSGLHPGDDWPEVIAAHLGKSSAVVAAYSMASVESHNCKNEVTYAIGNNISLVSLLLEDVKMPRAMKLQLSNSHVIRMYEAKDPEEFFSALLLVPALEKCRDDNRKAGPADLELWQCHVQEYQKSKGNDKKDEDQRNIFLDWLKEERGAGDHADGDKKREEERKRIGPEKTENNGLGEKKASSSRDPKDSGELKAVEDVAARLRQEAAEAEKKKHEIEAELKRIYDEAEKKKRETEAELKRLAAEAEEKKRRAEEAERKRREEEERKRQEEKEHRRQEEERKRREEEEHKRQIAAERQKREMLEKEAKQRAGVVARNGIEPADVTIRDMDPADITRRKGSQDITVRSDPLIPAIFCRKLTGDVFPLEKTRSVIGRSKDGTDIVLEGNREISRRHAEIMQQDHKLYLKDLGSSFGTEVNGLAVTGDEAVELGRIAFVSMGGEEFVLISGPDVKAARYEDRIGLLKSVRTGECRVLTDERLPLDRSHMWDNDVLGSRLISRKAHAVVSRTDGEFRLEDLNSPNGTFLNGNTVSGRAEKLFDGDEISVADEKFTFIEFPLKKRSFPDE